MDFANAEPFANYLYANFLVVSIIFEYECFISGYQWIQYNQIT